MLLDQSDNILAALDILCDVQWQALQPYRPRAFTALQRLQVILGNDNYSESPKSTNNSAPPLTSSDFLRPSSNDDGSSPLPDQSDSPPPPRNDGNPPSTSSHSHSLQSYSNRQGLPSPMPSESPSISCPLPLQTQHNHHDTTEHIGLLSSFPNSYSSSSSSSTSKFPMPLLDNREPPLEDHSSSSPHKITVALIEALNKAKGKIQEYLGKSEISATEGGSSWTQEDPRIVDLQMGEKKTTSNIKFRKVLSQRSLAKEYDRWELKAHQTSKISQLTEDLSGSKERADGHIKEYIRANTCQFKNTELAQDGIQCGIRLLVFERLLRESGSSAILCFSFHRFRRVSFSELACLVQQMREIDWIRDLAGEKSSWFDNCQRYYDGVVDSRLFDLPVPTNPAPSKRTCPASEPSGKRPRLGQYEHAVGSQSSSRNAISSSLTEFTVGHDSSRLIDQAFVTTGVGVQESTNLNMSE